KQDPFAASHGRVQEFCRVGDVWTKTLRYGTVLFHQLVGVKPLKRRRQCHESGVLKLHDTPKTSFHEIRSKQVAYSNPMYTASLVTIARTYPPHGRPNRLGNPRTL